MKLYSKLDLTYPDKDKIFALNGIATRSFQGSDVYLAGMFKGHLLLHLAWGTSLGSSRSKVWRAPSWSWLSVHGSAVELPSNTGNEIHLASIMNVSVELSDPDNQFGSLKSASLRLFCRPFMGTIQGEKLTTDFISQEPIDDFSPDDPSALEMVNGGVTFAPILIEIYVNDSERNLSSATSQDDLLVLRNIVLSSSARDEWSWICLVLQNTTGNSYTRLGRIRVFSMGSQGSITSLVDYVLETEGRSLTLE